MKKGEKIIKCPTCCGKKFYRVSHREEDETVFSCIECETELTFTTKNKYYFRAKSETDPFKGPHWTIKRVGIGLTRGLVQ
jgi:hypothetical protein